MSETQAECQELDSRVEAALYRLFTKPMELQRLLSGMEQKAYYDMVCEMMTKARVQFMFQDLSAQEEEILNAVQKVLRNARITYEFKPFEPIRMEE